MENREAFFAFVRAGLWEDVTNNVVFPTSINFEELRCLAEKQSVVGLVTAGIQISGIEIPLDQKLKFAGLCQLIEQRNKGMNQFIGELVKKTQDSHIKTLLVKGQGIAQCYERPLWRPSGDVDLLFDRKDYRKTTEFFLPLASSHKRDERYSSHLGLTIDSWYVEIHGTLRTGLSARVDKTVDEVQKDTFDNNKFRVWHNSDIDVLLPTPDNDVFFVFVHFLMHFYRETMCLRQLCDWCRLLWAFRAEIDRPLLEARLQKAGLMDEWKAFAVLAVVSLGMPVEAMPLYDGSECWHNKGERLLNFILKGRKPNKVRDTMFFLGQFPCNTLSFLPSIFFNVNRSKIKERLFGEG